MDHDQRREELTRAAMALVRDQGLAALSVRSLAAASGCSAGAVRHYLPTHASMVEAVATGVRAGFEARLRSVALKGDPVADARALLHAGLPLDDESRELSRVWFAFVEAASHSGGEVGLVAYAELARVLEGLFTGLDRAGRLLAASPREATVMLQSAFDGLTVHLLLGWISAAEAVAALDRVLGALVAAA